MSLLDNSINISRRTSRQIPTCGQVRNSTSWTSCRWVQHGLCEACAHEQPWNWEGIFSPDALAESLLKLPLSLDLPFMLSWKRERSCKVQHQLCPLLLFLPFYPSGSQKQPNSLTFLEVNRSICLIRGWVSMRAQYLYEGPLETDMKKTRSWLQIILHFIVITEKNVFISFKHSSNTFLCW